MTLLISKLNPTGRSRSRHNPHENCNSQMYRSSVPKSSTRASTSSITSLKTSPRSTRSSPRNRSSSGSKKRPQLPITPGGTNPHEIPVLNPLRLEANLPLATTSVDDGVVLGDRVHPVDLLFHS
uniref:(northern house mosquito) hypothetical protein n=1 Tax=Culex pipiens TaxID=7175 RepID=A0A8D8P286_CULPI